jgi:hypothetical protein
MKLARWREWRDLVHEQNIDEAFAVKDPARTRQKAREPFKFIVESDMGAKC